MNLTLNGEPHTLPDEGAAWTVTALIEHLGLEGGRVAVEQNGRIVRKADHAVATLSEGDVVEVVTFVGGG